MATISTKSESEQVGESIVNQIAALLGEQSANINSFVTTEFNQLQTELKEILKQMATLASVLSSLGTAVQALGTENTQLLTDVSTLLTSVADGNAPDVTAIQAAVTSINTVIANQQVQAAITAAGGTGTPAPSTPAPAAPSGS